MNDASSPAPRRLGELPTSRRSILRSGAAAVGASAAALAIGRTAAAAEPPPAAPAFLHAVASGDPMPDRVIIWTRVTPAPAAVPGSGLGAPTRVRWEIARDARFDSVVRSGTVTTDADRDHTVKIDVTGLTPRTGYHYRFTITDGPASGQVSPIGRTRTAPAPGQAIDRQRFAVCSCSNWEAGYFSAYRHMAGRGDLDAVIHLGDYFYEYPRGEYTGKTGAVRAVEPPHETVTLQDYRTRFGCYRSDADLANLHAQVPMIAVWDDHESANDAWLHGAENHDDASEGPWEARKAASARAYFEWMPVRPTALHGDGHLYRRLRFGDLVELSVLDLRSYKSEAVAPAAGAAIDDPNRTITGRDQMDWLTAGLVSSSARWKLIGNPVMITPVLIPPLDPRTTSAFTDMLGLPQDGITYNADQWDGYTADRRRLFDAIHDNGVSDVVFVTGDIHSTWAAEQPLVPGRYVSGTPVVAAELVPPSITASNIDDILKLPLRNPLSLAAEEALKAANPHIKDVELDNHGFGVVDVTPESVQMDVWFVDEKTNADSGIRFYKGFRVAAGSPRVQLVGTPVGPYSPA